MPKDAEDTDKTEPNNRLKNAGRRGFLKKAAFGFGGIGLGALGWDSIDQSAYGMTSKDTTNNSTTNNSTSNVVGQPNVNGNLKPSKLKVTDMRVAVLEGVPFTNPIVKIYTNQGITGLGEVRDGADKRLALMLKSIILGRNPLDVEQLYKELRRFGGHGRKGGGVSAVETALMDIVGKAYDVPVHQLLGGQYVDKVRLYTDTTESEDPKVYAQRMKEKLENTGFTFVKMDLGIGLIDDIPGALVGEDYWEGPNKELDQYNYGKGAYDNTYGSAEHPFTRIQITDKGIDAMAKYLKAMREAIGYDIPLGADHFGHFGMNDLLQMAERFKEYDLAYMENVVPWFYTDRLKEFTQSTTMPSMVGEDIFGLDPTLEGTGSPSLGFKALIDQNAVDLIHPDLTTAGGITETKKIADYAQANGTAMFLHHAGTPIGAMASAHVAAASYNFIALENHAAGVEFWSDLVTGVGNTKLNKPLAKDGFYSVPETPGLGVEMNDKVAKKHLVKGEKYFAPTPEWNDVIRRPPWE